MIDRKTYIIADFVKILGVARTTLNDWLVRYEQYIEYEVRGHRKIYFETSLNVLKDIAEMRKDGKNTSEILAELSKKHPVNADIAPEAEKTPQENLPAQKEASLDSLLPVFKQQNEEMERLLVRKLQDMAADLHHAQLDANHVSKANTRWIALCIALVVALGGTILYNTKNVHDVLNSQQKAFSGAQEKLGKSIEQSGAAITGESKKREAADQKHQEKIDDLTILLSKSNQKSSKEIQMLKKEITANRKAFKDTLEKNNMKMLEQHKLELGLLKESYNKERIGLLDKIKKLNSEKKNENSDDKKREIEVAELKKKIFELKGKIEIMERKKKEAKKPVQPVLFLKRYNQSGK